MIYMKKFPKKLSMIFIISLIGIMGFSITESAAESNQICIDKVWIENTRGKIACVTSSTAEKLVERGWGTLLDVVEDTSDEKSITPVVSGGTLPIT